MSSYNYIVTAQNPTAVSHSCVGNFTGPEDHNLIVAKCTHIEVHSVTEGRPQILFDVPIYGKISTLHLFRPQGETQDLLLIATQRQKFSVLRWDPDAKEIVTRAICDTSGTSDGTSSDNSGGTDSDSSCSDTSADAIPDTSASGQAVIIDPGCKVIALHMYTELIKVVPLDDKGQPQETFNLKLKDVEALKVLDVKFLYECTKPTLVVLCKRYPQIIAEAESESENEDEPDCPCSLRTYEVSLEDKNFVLGPWTYKIDDKKADLLIPVPPPLCGVLVIGEETIAYCSLSTFISIRATPLIERSYDTREFGFDIALPNIRSDHFDLAHTRVDMDGCGILLCDHAGKLWSLVLDRNNDNAIVPVIQLLGETSKASTISHLDNGLLYVGSRDGDSQLIRLNLQDGTSVEVLERYMNLGPISDFCVAHYERQGQVAVVTCSGRDQAGSLRIVSKKTQINKLASADIQAIKGMWSLRSGTDDYLVVSFVSETAILAMSVNEQEYTIEDTGIEGFCIEEQTLFCHDARHDQFVQVTSRSVRLVSLTSGKLAQEWRPPAQVSINVATANANQVLLATSGRRLYYLEIGDVVLLPKNMTELQNDISCLHIRPIGEGADLAAVGTWTDVCVKILSLPDLKVITEKRFSSESMRPCAVLFCALEEICYLFCMLGDGHLFHFVLDLGTKVLLSTGMKEVSVGTQPWSLQAFSHKNTTHVFVASDRPKVIYSSNKKLHYSDVNLEEVSHMCPFRCAAFPDSLVFAQKDTLSVGTIGEDFQRLHVRSIYFEEQVRCIAQQKKSNTFAICRNCRVHLLDDQKFATLDSYSLGKGNLGYSIVSCSFSGDEEDYYRVGTKDGSVFVFVVNGGRLELAVRERLDLYDFRSLHAYKGRLFAVFSEELLLLKWNLGGDGTRKLGIQYKYELPAGTDFCVQIYGDSIMASGKEIGLIVYQHEDGFIKKVARYDDKMRSAFILDDIYLGATIDRRLLTTDGQKVGHESHVDEQVNRFRQGSLVLHSSVGETPTIIYGTESGAIGVIASLPQEQFTFTEMLQTGMRKVVQGVGGFSHEQWRNSRKKDIRSAGFLDGDLLKSFLDLDFQKMTEISELTSLPVEELRKRVEDLKRLY